MLMSNTYSINLCHIISVQILLYSIKKNILNIFFLHIHKFPSIVFHTFSN